jgi:hypothetical protein
VRSLRFLLVLVVALELAVWEAFLVAARPFGTALPLAAALAAAGNLGLGLLGARVLGKPVGAGVPGLVWLLAAMPLATTGPGGDAVVTGDWRGVAFLVAGAAAAVAAVGVTSARQNGATPEVEMRR